MYVTHFVPSILYFSRLLWKRMITRQCQYHTLPWSCVTGHSVCPMCNLIADWIHFIVICYTDWNGGRLKTHTGPRCRVSKTKSVTAGCWGVTFGDKCGIITLSYFDLLSYYLCESLALSGQYIMDLAHVDIKKAMFASTTGFIMRLKQFCQKKYVYVKPEITPEYSTFQLIIIFIFFRKRNYHNFIWLLYSFFSHSHSW